VITVAKSKESPGKPNNCLATLLFFDMTILINVKIPGPRDKLPAFVKYIAGGEACERRAKILFVIFFESDLN